MLRDERLTKQDPRVAFRAFGAAHLPLRDDRALGRAGVVAGTCSIRGRGVPLVFAAVTAFVTTQYTRYTGRILEANQATVQEMRLQREVSTL